ncbi:hypothetical protein EZS27_025675 [termite gut metagenome]|uniref:Uncharacterized protein n=1 Tax=termite gut metagenome TaxID=433724 RepID=A0A5J4QU58_9ZZZZ
MRTMIVERFSFVKIIGIFGQYPLNLPDKIFCFVVFAGKRNIPHMDNHILLEENF